MPLYTTSPSSRRRTHPTPTMKTCGTQINTHPHTHPLYHVPSLLTASLIPAVCRVQEQHWRGRRDRES